MTTRRSFLAASTVHSFLKAHRQPMSLQPNFPQNGMQKPMS